MGKIALIEESLACGVAFNADSTLLGSRVGAVSENPITRTRSGNARTTANLLEGSTFLHTLELVDSDMGYARRVSSGGWTCVAAVYDAGSCSGSFLCCLS